MAGENKKRYPLIFFNLGPKRLLSLGITALILLVAIGIFLWYNQVSNDLTPDSILGYSFAILGTFFALLAGIRYSRYRRSRKRGVGQLNGSLNWHISFAIIAFVLLFMHSFGNFNPRSGTYALFGMIALVISGFIGRGLDHLFPRLIAKEVARALTGQGEDRVEAITQQIQSMMVYNKQDVRGFNVAAMKAPSFSTPKPVPLKGTLATHVEAESKQGLQTPWDLAYISLEELPQEIQQEAKQYRFVPERKSEFTRPGTLIPGVQEQLHELQKVEQALQREQFYRHVIRYWRVFHVCLALVTLGLTLWHLEYAAQLLIPALPQLLHR